MQLVFKAVYVSSTSSLFKYTIRSGHRERGHRDRAMDVTQCSEPSVNYYSIFTLTALLYFFHFKVYYLINI